MGRIARFFIGRPYHMLAHYLLIGYCLFSCLSIAVAQFFVVPVLICWLAQAAGLIPGRRTDGEINPLPGRTLALIICAWVGVSLVAGLVGIDPLKAIPETIRSSIYLLLPFAVLTSFKQAELSDRDLLKRVMAYVTALISSQALAAIHTVASAALGHEIKPGIPGPVTESGQLLLTLHLFISACFIASSLATINSDLKQRHRIRLFGLTIPPAVLGGAALMVLLLIAWPQVTDFSPALSTALQSTLTVVLVLVAGLLLLPPLFKPASRTSGGQDQLALAFFSIAGALLVGAFVINLKRGPWLGFGFSLLLLGVILARKRLIGAVLGGSLVLFLLGPAHQRIINFAADYEITGGRKNMWQLGMELIERYPLGLGLGNASYMRIVDPSLPRQHRHMHNNLLNIAVESGLIGLAAYLAWMLFAISLGIRLWNNAKTSQQQYVPLLALCGLSISCAFLGWQIAGSVEYNFGDGEIRMIVLLMMGLLVTIAGRLINRVSALRSGSRP